MAGKFTSSTQAIPAVVDVPQHIGALGFDVGGRRGEREADHLGRDVELGDDMALAMRAPVLGYVGDPVHHQHGRCGQLRIAGAEQLAPRAFQQVFLVELRRIKTHWPRFPPQDQCCQPV